MKAQRVYRIERVSQPNGIDLAVGITDATDTVDDSAIMSELAEIKTMLSSSGEAAQPDQKASVDVEFMERYRAEIAEALKLKSELDSIYTAIAETKTEIASLHFTSLDGDEVSRVTDELGAVISGTEHATEIILAAAEAIDENANNLCAKLEGADQGMASDIQEQVVSVFEACNFQDLTGQRITKVVNALRFIEERVESMMSIWGGIDSFSGISPIKRDVAEGDAALLNGPALETDIGLASQADIDALFD